MSILFVTAFILVLAESLSLIELLINPKEKHNEEILPWEPLQSGLWGQPSGSQSDWKDYHNKLHQLK